MLARTMGTTKATKRRTAPATPQASTARADGRTKSALTIAGDQAKIDAERALLREALAANGWNATQAGRALGIAHYQTVMRQIDRLGLRAEYDRHNAAD